jgi:hypothetical protein
VLKTGLIYLGCPPKLGDLLLQEGHALPPSLELLLQEGQAFIQRSGAQPCPFDHRRSLELADLVLKKSDPFLEPLQWHILSDVIRLFHVVAFVP